MGQPSHWTYRSFNAADGLRQGDIIRRSPALLTVLRDVLSHFCDERYTGFLVVTQSCDLVQREQERCKAEYVNLCVIRELEPLLPNILEPCCGAGIPGVFASDNRRYAEQLLKRVLNQNEQARGLFYLHPDAGVGVATPSVALLRVSIALRRQHYQMLQECRCGRLAAEYSAKLGWLTGNLYSRIATPDWEDQENDETASSKQARLLLRQLTKPGDENWVPVTWVKAAREKDVDLMSIPADRFRSTLAQHAPPELLDVVLESVRRVGRGAVADTPCDIISDRLAGDDQLAREIAHRVANCATACLSAQEQAALAKSLAADARFRKAIGDQVASLLKQRALEIAEQAVSELPTLLAGSTGVLKPAGNRLRAVLSVLVGAGGDDEVDQIVDLVAGTCVFSAAAAEMVQGVVEETFANVGFRAIDKLISRLRNDQKLRAACRARSSDEVAFSPFPD